MTLLVSWVGIDTHGPSSIYIASDSQISWGTSAKFDLGRKVFAFSKWPDILGYCGDVLFPSIVLNQIVELGDAGLLFAPTYSCTQKFQAIVNKLNDSFAAYPQMHSGLAENSLSVIHASRDPFVTSLGSGLANCITGSGCVLGHHGNTMQACPQPITR